MKAVLRPLEILWLESKVPLKDQSGTDSVVITQQYNEVFTHN